MAKKRKLPPFKLYVVNIGMVVTEDVYVKARTPSEARKKGWKKWKAKRKYFDVLAEQLG